MIAKFSGDLFAIFKALYPSQNWHIPNTIHNRKSKYQEVSTLNYPVIFQDLELFVQEVFRSNEIASNFRRVSKNT